MLLVLRELPTQGAAEAVLPLYLEALLLVAQVGLA
jgi:hypothetical protein